MLEFQEDKARKEAEQEEREQEKQRALEEQARLAEENRLEKEARQEAEQEERNYWIEDARWWRDEMQKYYNQTVEELEFYEFKLSLKKELLTKATTEEAKAELAAQVEEANQEIRWIQQRIGDEKSGLQEAQNSLDYEIAYDLSVRSE